MRAPLRNGRRPVCLFVAPQCVQPLFKATAVKDTMQAQPDGGSDQSIEQRCCPPPGAPGACTMIVTAMGMITGMMRIRAISIAAPGRAPDDYECRVS